MNGSSLRLFITIPSGLVYSDAKCTHFNAPSHRKTNTLSPPPPLGRGLYPCTRLGREVSAERVLAARCLW